MKQVKVLGIGCANCNNTVKLIAEVANELQIDINIEKIEDMRKIAAYKIMATPGVVIDDKVVHAGGIPARAKIVSWFTNN